MTEPMAPERRAEISTALAAVPAPPWHWIGDTRTGPALVTKHSGWRYVMGFRRLGMNGAQPNFPTAIPPRGHTIMVSARDQIIPHTDYDTRTFRGIDNPVAQFLEHSAQYVAELLAENERLRSELAERAKAGGQS